MHDQMLTSIEASSTTHATTTVTATQNKQKRKNNKKNRMMALSASDVNSSRSGENDTELAKFQFSPNSNSIMKDYKVRKVITPLSINDLELDFQTTAMSVSPDSNGGKENIKQNRLNIIRKNSRENYHNSSSENIITNLGMAENIVQQFFHNSHLHQL